MRPFGSVIYRSFVVIDRRKMLAVLITMIVSLFLIRLMTLAYESYAIISTLSILICVKRESPMKELNV